MQTFEDKYLNVEYRYVIFVSISCIIVSSLLGYFNSELSLFYCVLFSASCVFVYQCGLSLYFYLDYENGWKRFEPKTEELFKREELFFNKHLFLKLFVIYQINVMMVSPFVGLIFKLFF